MAGALSGGVGTAMVVKSDTAGHEWVWSRSPRHEIGPRTRPFPRKEDMMLTPAGRLAVSAISLAATLVLGACAGRPSPTTWGETAVTTGQGATIRFVNEAETYVDVYLVGETREWWLGRVAPGARTTLRIRDDLLAATSGYLRLAVLAGAKLTAQAARDPRATFTIAQPGPSLFDQRWTFRQSQLMAPELFGAPVRLGGR